MSEGMSIELPKLKCKEKKKNEIKTGQRVENIQELEDNKKNYLHNRNTEGEE